MQYKEEPGQLKEPVSLVPKGRYLEESTGVRSLAVAEVAEKRSVLSAAALIEAAYLWKIFKTMLHRQLKCFAPNRNGQYNGQYMVYYKHYNRGGFN